MAYPNMALGNQMFCQMFYNFLPSNFAQPVVAYQTHVNNFLNGTQYFQNEMLQHHIQWQQKLHQYYRIGSPFCLDGNFGSNVPFMIQNEIKQPENTVGQFQNAFKGSQYPALRNRRGNKRSRCSARSKTRDVYNFQDSRRNPVNEEGNVLVSNNKASRVPLIDSNTHKSENSIFYINGNINSEVICESLNNSVQNNFDSMESSYEGYSNHNMTNSDEMQMDQVRHFVFYFHFKHREFRKDFSYLRF
ncbi:hypothetical protein NPIL_8681 [Nephila pilipes]|uniref:Uncharacterized protein n=1 Tax=Nephila pilipes TaxID=299642 RepID=A0A8X6Q6G0_NEPPI|nr:hypothetical protein NPIL_8681 [Nephila pilipes]